MPHTADQYQRAAEEAKQLAAKATDSCVAGLHMERGMAERICSVPSRCFCARMRKAIEAGLESAPIGVVTTPGTQTPRYVPAEPRPPASSSGDTNF